MARFLFLHPTSNLQLHQQMLPKTEPPESELNNHHSHHPVQQLQPTQQVQPVQPLPLLQQPAQREPFSLFIPHIITEKYNIFKMAIARIARPMAAKNYQPMDISDSEVDELAVKAPPPTPRPRKKAASSATPKPPRKRTPRSAPKEITLRLSSVPKTAGAGAATRRKSLPNGNSPLNKVLQGKVSKGYRSSTLARRSSGEDEVDELVKVLNEEIRESEAQCEEDMLDEKKKWPGSEAWAREENAVFEAMYMMQFRPSLPASWVVDMRGIPTPVAIYAGNQDERTPVYSHSGNEYQATRAFGRLITLTADVRSLIQSGHRHKAASTIRAALYRYIGWAAKDGGFDHLEVIPTFALEIIDPNLSGDEVTQRIQEQMRELAERHRHSPIVKREEFHEDTPIPSIEDSDGSFMPSSPSPGQAYPPPVLYGLFIINSIVVIATADSAKTGDGFQVSILIDARFNSSFHGIWNALTVAIPVCMARDEMVKRKSAFHPLDVETDSDPDA